MSKCVDIKDKKRKGEEEDDKDDKGKKGKTTWYITFEEKAGIYTSACDLLLFSWLWLRLVLRERERKEQYGCCVTHISGIATS